MKKKQKKDDALAELLSAASPKVLCDLIKTLAKQRPNVRRECFNYLKRHVSASDELKKRSEGEIVLSLWGELAFDLSELDEYGGGDYAVEDHVGELLDQIRRHLDSKKIESVYRRKILDRVLPYIESGNAGLDDMLYGVAHAACYDHSDLRQLAEAFEDMQDDWKIGHARDIYRSLGDRDKYLELRHQKMTYGGDYYDLAMFYWDNGEKKEALKVANEGIRKGRGRMDELRRFLAERAKESGDREQYLDLQFAHATDCLTLEKYKAFKKICKRNEWVRYEPRILAGMKNAWDTEQLKIRMHRKEYDEAIALLTNSHYPTMPWDGDYEIRTAKNLEKRYPEEVLKYYLSGLGNLKDKATRKEYARKAKIIAKVRHLLVEVMNDKKRWQSLAVKIKQDNIKRPAFQEEFNKAVKGWEELK